MCENLRMIDRTWRSTINMCENLRMIDRTWRAGNGIRKSLRQNADWSASQETKY